MGNMKLHSVNWQDGMLISQRHLKEQEAFLEDLARWYAQAPGDRFGLMQKPGDPDPSLILEASGGGWRLKIFPQQHGVVILHIPDRALREIVDAFERYQNRQIEKNLYKMGCFMKIKEMNGP